MFADDFNLSFNLHKSYVDIGVADDDIKRLSQVYGICDGEAAQMLKNFKAENEKNAKTIKNKVDISSVSREKEFRIAYLGDSITSYRMSHQNIIKAVFRDFDNIVFKDFAISGYKVGDVLTGLFPGVIEFKPNIAVMMIGTNDMRQTKDKYNINHTSKEEYERDLLYIVNYLKDTGCKTAMITLPPFDMDKISETLEGYNILYTDITRNAYDDAIIRTSAVTESPLVDMREVYKKYMPKDITLDDGLHLNLEGQTILAGEVLPKLVEIMK